MKISNNLNINNTYNKLSNNKLLPADNPAFTQALLPALSVNGQSQINSSIPVNYSKINEITIPGIETKATVFKLSNGHKIVILPKKGPTVIRTTFNVGAFNETPDNKGISHFIEHNLFNGSKNLLPKQYDKSVSDMGGYTNASTSFDKTDYYISLQLLDDNSLENAIKLNSDLTQYPSFPIDQLDKEKSPVNSEIDMYKDDITDVSFGTMLKNLFGIESDCSNLILGSHKNINSFSRNQVLDYFNTWYTPDNAVTVITGDVDVDKTISLAAKYYTKKLDTAYLNNRYYQPVNPINSSIRQDIIKKGSDNAAVTLGFALPDSVSDKELTALSLINYILSANNSSLSKKLDKFGISAPVFSVEYLFNKKNSPKCLYSSLISQEQDLEKVIKVLYDEINNMSVSPIDIATLNDAKKNFLSDFQNKISEYSEDINLLLTKISQFDDYNYIQNTIADINSITPDFILQTAKKYMNLNKSSLCAAHAENTSNEQILENYRGSLNYNPSFGNSSVKSNILKDVTSVKCFSLPNNIQTNIIPSSNSVSSCLSMSIENDLLTSVPKPAFDILTELLNRGSSSLDENLYNDILNSKNIKLTFSASPMGIDICADYDEDKTADVISIIKNVLYSPNFDESKFNIIKNNIKNNLISQNKNPDDLINQTIFPNIKTFNSVQEQIKQIDDISLNDIKNLFYHIMSSSQCQATFTSPINQKPYLTDVINSNLSSGMPYFQPVIINRKLNTNTFQPILQPITVTAAQNSIQANIVQAYTFKYSPNISDIAKIKLLNIILGGSSMSSRLFTDLRETQKLAYSVGSFINSQNDTGVINLYINTSTDSESDNSQTPENVSKAIQGFQKNINLLKTQTISPKELQIAKNKLKTSILNEQEGNLSFNSQLHGIKNSSYGLNYIQELYNAIDNISEQDILNTANYVFRYQPVTAIVASQKTLDYINK